MILISKSIAEPFILQTKKKKKKKKEKRERARKTEKGQTNCFTMVWSSYLGLQVTFNKKIDMQIRIVVI